MPFRHRDVGGKVLITNTEGNFLLLSPEEFASFAQGDGRQGHAALPAPRRAQLRPGRGRHATHGRALRARKTFLHYGPNLHIVVVTLRCNETCVYCHASRADMSATHTDMTKETADKTVDLVFQSTNPSVTIEFQGGEPLVNFDVVKHIIERAREKNKTAGKRLEFTMVSNLSLHGRGEARVPGRQPACRSARASTGRSTCTTSSASSRGCRRHQTATNWIRRINEAYAKMGLDPTLYHVEALLTTTRETLPTLEGGRRHVRRPRLPRALPAPGGPFGFADRTAPRVEYPRAEYLEFYRNAVDYMLELNKRGVEILERFAAIFLTKILGGEDPNFLDIRSPCGAGIGQIAYNYDGKVFTCDEGRMLHEMGDSTFLIGDVGDDVRATGSSWGTRRCARWPSRRTSTPSPTASTAPTSRTAASARSTTTRRRGRIFGRMRESTLCAVHKGIQDYLFAKIGSGDRRDAGDLPAVDDGPRPDALPPDLRDLDVDVGRGLRVD